VAREARRKRPYGFSEEWGNAPSFIQRSAVGLIDVLRASFDTSVPPLAHGEDDTVDAVTWLLLEDIIENNEVFTLVTVEYVPHTKLLNDSTRFSDFFPLSDEELFILEGAFGSYFLEPITFVMAPSKAKPPLYQANGLPFTAKGTSADAIPASSTSSLLSHVVITSSVKNGSRGLKRVTDIASDSSRRISFKFMPSKRRRKAVRMI
jgi:hypothetical protein